MLAHAQDLVYSLKELMPTSYQKDNLEAMLGLFLEAQGHPLPEHSQTKSASALSRFLNINPWSTRGLIRTVRDYALKQVLSESPKGSKKSDKTGQPSSELLVGYSLLLIQGCPVLSSFSVGDVNHFYR